MRPVTRALKARRLGARALALLVAVAAGPLAATGASALSAPGMGSTWISAGMLAGTTRFDPHLADYQWEVSPRVGWGAQVLAGHGRLSGGGRLWSSETTQRTGLGADPRVHTTRWELKAEGRLAKLAGAELLAVACGGRLALRYQPDRLDVPVSGGSAVTVEFKPIHEWIGGGGVAVRRALPGGFSAGLEVDHRWFGLDTAHVNGGVVELQRESFGEWSAEIELARVFGL